MLVSLRFELVEHVMLLVHAEAPPRAEDWAQMRAMRNAHRDRIRSNLVVAPGEASIDAAQRADVAEFMKETGTSVAVVTDSALIRGVAQAVGFLGAQIKAFGPTELSSALNFLVVPPSRHADMIRRVEAMKLELGWSREH